MRCIRPESQNGTIVQCDRCQRNSRPCSIPEPRPLGRKPGATGKYRGVEKAFRKMQYELRKSRGSSSGPQSIEAFSVQDEQVDLDEPFQHDALALAPAGIALTSSTEASMAPLPPASVSLSLDTPSPTGSKSQRGSSRRAPANAGRDTISNPLGLLADASGKAQALDRLSQASATSPVSAPESSSRQQASPSTLSEPCGLARYLLRRPGYVSLGLSIGSDCLEQGLDALFAPPGEFHQYVNYFKSAEESPTLDTGPDVDPVDLGLISMSDAYYLFPLLVDASITCLSALLLTNSLLAQLLRSPSSDQRNT